MPTEYPLPVFYYNAQISGVDDAISFSEVSGLSVEYETITYKDGLSFREGFKYMPGMRAPVNLTLKRGVTKSGKHLYDWFSTIDLNTVSKRDVTISLMDESHEAVVSWKAVNAFPKKIEAPGFNATSNEVAIESMELMADDLKITYEK